MSNIGSTSAASSGALRTGGRGGVRRVFTETRPSFRTSEFIAFVVTSLLVVLAAYTDEAFDVDHGWTLVTILAVGYMLSRGIAKAGSRETYTRGGGDVDR